MTKPGGLAWTGATIVWVGAAALSFAGLHDLAVTCNVSTRLAWLLPLVIDVGVAVAAWVWRRGVNAEASKLAGRLTWSLLVLTVAGNGAHLGMEASHITPPWWVAAVVGAVPPAVAGAVAHLLVLLGRTVAVEATEGRTSEHGATAPCDFTAAAPVRPTQSEPVAAPTRVAPTDAELLVLARQVLADDPTIGRPRLASALGVTPHKARQILGQLGTPSSNGHAPVGAK